MDKLVIPLTEVCLCGCRCVCVGGLGRSDEIGFARFWNTNASLFQGFYQFRHYVQFVVFRTFQHDGLKPGIGGVRPQNDA